MAKTKTKSGSKVKVTCQLCGKVVTRAGMIGHMHWKHGKVYNAPLLDKTKPMQYQEARRKAEAYDAFLDKLVPELVAKAKPTNEAHTLVRLHDAGLSNETMRVFVTDAINRIMQARKVSFDEAHKLLKTAIDETDMSGHRKR
jgi:hypothetical protein